MADITKPIISDKDIWAQDADPQRDIIPPLETIPTGWTYEDKPSYQALNWYWKYVTQFLAHWNENGVPEWDKNTYYATGSQVRYNNMVYTCVSPSQGVLPTDIGSSWVNNDSLASLSDVSIDKARENEVITLKGTFWNNNRVTDILNIDLNSLEDVTVGSTPDYILAVNNETPGQADTWTDQDPLTLSTNKLYLSSFSDTKIENPVDGEVLQYKEVSITNPDGTEYKTNKWVNTVFTGSVNWNNIKNTPDYLQARRAISFRVGGLRLWAIGTTFYMSNARLDYIPAPFDMKLTPESGGMKLQWTGTSLADKYYIYRDNTKVGETAGIETEYLDSTPDLSWHIYHVTAVDASGNESYPSNQELGKVLP